MKHLKNTSSMQPGTEQ